MDGAGGEGGSVMAGRGAGGRKDEIVSRACQIFNPSEWHKEKLRRN